jgi:hypothetical protein
LVLRKCLKLTPLMSRLKSSQMVCVLLKHGSFT